MWVKISIQETIHFSQFRNLLDTTIQKNYHNKIRLSQRNPCKIKVFLGCPYYTAISNQYIPELWQFINARLTKEMPDWEDSRIIVHLEHQSTHLILLHQFLLTFFRIRIHRTDLIDIEDSSVSSNSLL